MTVPSARCPRCHNPTTTTAAGRDRWFCHHCRMEFETADDGTDSDISYGQSDRRLIRQEEGRRKEAERRLKKRQGKQQESREYLGRNYPSLDAGD